MIDTDKYEGHTEGPWEFKHINSNWYQCDKIGEMHMEDIAIEEASVNAQLMADAPLLLAEVKRLDFQLDGSIKAGITWIEKCEELDAEVKRLRSTIEILAADYDSLILDLGRASTGDLDIEEVYEKHLMGVNDE